MKINDSGIRNSWAGISSDNRVTRPEVEKLIGAAYDSARVTSTEKADLKRILAERGDTFTAPARAALEQFIDALRPDGTHPSRSIDLGDGASTAPLKLNDAGLRGLWAQVASDARVTRPEVEQIIRTAYDSARVTSTEKADLQRMLSEKGNPFTPAARAALENFLAGLNADGTHPDLVGNA
jgi:predicted DNA-binding protein (MmcQ/YjbR family)